MTVVDSDCELPAEALLRRYAGSGHTDCYATVLPRRVLHTQFVEAFYTTWVFKLERLILALIAKGSTDRQAQALARGETERFAAWSVEARAPNQLLLCDFLGRTRSWLMVMPEDSATRLYFGSAVVPRADGTLGANYSALLGFHKLYSRILLSAAASKLRREY